MPIDATDVALQGRLHPVTPESGDKFTLVFDDIEVNAVSIPHSGWPTRHAEIENISFKVSLDELATVLHMGDAHTDPAFFDKQAEYWAERQLHLALPPYWYFLSNGGKKILEDHIHAEEVFGVHVPKDVPDSPAQYPEELRGWTLLSVPGEERRISISDDEK
jgi:L-ascorbate metabolism protein UlaG (beta-lactamase superfamily)